MQPITEIKIGTETYEYNAAALAKLPLSVMRKVINAAETKALAEVAFPEWREILGLNKRAQIERMPGNDTDDRKAWQAYEGCAGCDGDGSIYSAKGKGHDCPVCDGSGEEEGVWFLTDTDLRVVWSSETGNITHAVPD